MCACVYGEPPLVDTTGTNNFVLYNEVSLTQAFAIVTVAIGLCDWAVEHNVATFSEPSLLYAKHAEASTISNSA